MELPSSPEFIISCEHAGNHVPEDYQSLFDGADEILRSHRGWDPGSLELAQTLAEKTSSELFAYPFTRLFIELNRSIGHPKLFSEFSRPLKKSEKQAIIEKYYLPHRNNVAEAIKQNASKNQPTIHISVHTFSPVLEKKERNFEIGLLNDPKRNLERNICLIWNSLLKEEFPDFCIRMNQPYKGTSDGFTTFLRKMFDEILYLGIELEVNQKLFFEGEKKWISTCSKIGESLSRLMGITLNNKKP